MDVFVKGKGKITLSTSDFVAEGGQAKVFQKNGTAYKLYSDPKYAIPEAKFSQLAAIKDPNVVKPEALLLSAKGSPEPIGYTMNFVKNTVSLCQLFPKSFRDRNNITHEMIRELVRKLQEHVENVHRSGALIVDLNELNVLVTQAFDDLYLIDVDSYQTPGYRAEVIMPSVRDWSVSASAFSELSDWFSFAVLACQMFLGIHPYRGKHAASDSVPPDQRLMHRMKNHISIFNSAVSMPKVVFPLDVIPVPQRMWLAAVLEAGHRGAPPSWSALVHNIRTQAPQTMLFGGQLVVTELFSVAGDILSFCEAAQGDMSLTAEGIQRSKLPLYRATFQGSTLFGYTPKFARPIALNLHAGKLYLHELDEHRVTELQFAASEIARSGDRFYARSGTGVLEIDFIEMKTQTTAVASHAVASVLENASRLFEGCAIQNMLGSVFVSLFPKSRTGYQVRVPQLDKCKIVDARFERGILMVITARDGVYERMIVWFNQDFSSYDMITTPLGAPADLNFLVTDAGVCVMLAEDEKLHVFRGQFGAPLAVKIISDPALGGDMRLTRVGGRPGFIRGNKVFSISMK